MKVQKKKKTRKTLTFFQMIFGLKTPYQVLVDPEFIKEASVRKLYLNEKLPEVLQDKAYPVSTNCIIAAMQKIEQLSGEVIFVKKYKRVKCGHETPIPANQCIKSVLKIHPTTYIGAIQNGKLRAELRKIPGLPLMFVRNTKLEVEEPSNSSKDAANEVHQKKLDQQLTTTSKPEHRKMKEENKEKQEAETPAVTAKEEEESPTHNNVADKVQQNVKEHSTSTKRKREEPVDKKPTFKQILLKRKKLKTQRHVEV